MRRVYFVLLVLAAIFLILGAGGCVESGSGQESYSGKVALSKGKTDPSEWFKQDKFGMFVHWSIPSVYEEQWVKVIGKPRDKATDRETMWSMRRGKIPVETYEKLTRYFNPVGYDAEAFARTAKNAGMKYIVITAKHHDGFAMFDSAVSEFDVMDATPYGKDIMAPLAKACKKYGLRLCFYYSQAQDWHHPDGAGNDWDFDPATKDFARYFEAKCKPQVRELLTQYGPLGLIWFDTPAVINPAQSEELYHLVKSIQPNCLVNSRVGHGFGDYLSTGDNQIAEAVTAFPWEVPATINDHWSWQAEQNWKDPGDITRKLVYIVSRGGNYLLNVGPDPEGVIPAQSVENLAEIGKWLKVNGEAIYGTRANPFLRDFPWGVATAKYGFIYLHVTDRPGGEIVLHGIQNEIKDCYLLRGRKRLSFSCENDKAAGLRQVHIKLPDVAPDDYVSVIALKIDGAPRIDTRPVQEGREVVLPCSGLPLSFGRGGFTIPAIPLDGARVRYSGEKPALQLSPEGSYIEGWNDPGESLSWEFVTSSPGRFRVTATFAKIRRWNQDRTGFIYDAPSGKVRVHIDGTELTGEIPAGGDSSKSNDMDIVLGEVYLGTAGVHRLEFAAEEITSKRNIGLTLRQVLLERLD